MILAIETATATCSVALGVDGNVIDSDSSHIDKSHSKILTGQIQSLIARSEKQLDQLSVVAISIGPGSYTGLRIGLSVAKGLCYALDIPLIGISTLASLAHHGIEKIQQSDCLYVPLIDARRQGVYTAVYNNELSCLQDESALELTSNSFAHLLEKKKIHFFGNATDKASKIIDHDNAMFHSELAITSESLIPLAYKRAKSNLFDSVAYLEPMYLKGLYTKTPQK